MIKNLYIKHNKNYFKSENWECRLWLSKQASQPASEQASKRASKQASQSASKQESKQASKQIFTGPLTWPDKKLFIFDTLKVHFHGGDVAH